MTRDWHAWYRHYDDPTSSLSRRLGVVRELLAAELDRRTDLGRRVHLLSLCAGDGRDTLPVLARSRASVSAVLVELDEALATTALVETARLGLGGVDVRTADAGATSSLRGAVPADVLMLCGVLGNVTDDDAARLVSLLPGLLAADATVIWTRGRFPADGPDPADAVRRLLADGGFREQSFVRPDDADFRVGVHRLVADPAPWPGDVRLFTFV